MSKQAYVQNDGVSQENFGTWEIHKSWNSKRAESESGSFIEVTTEDVNLLPGETSNIQIRTTEEIDSYKIMVIYMNTPDLHE